MEIELVTCKTGKSYIYIHRARLCVCVCVTKFMIGIRKSGHTIFVSHRIVLDVVLANY